MTITVASDTTSAATASPGSLTFTPSGATAWNFSQTVTVTAVDDALDQASPRIATITHSVASTDSFYNNLMVADVEVSVADDDVPEITISKGDDVTEGATVVFTVSSDPAPAADLTVNVSVTQSGEFIDGAPPTTVVIPTGGSVTLSVNTDNDFVDEADGSVTATLTAGAGYTVGSPSSATVNIADDEVAGRPTVTIASDDSSAVVEGGSLTFTLSIDAAPSANLPVALSVTGPAGTDFVTDGNRTENIASGATSQTFTVATNADEVNEVNGLVTLTLLPSADYNVGDPGSATAQVNDDDPMTPFPVLSDWALIPSGLSVGDSFRLLFITSTTRDSTAPDIATYNQFVQAAATAGHIALDADLAPMFRVVGCTEAVDARDNTFTNKHTDGAGEPIYWLNGEKIADNYAGFYVEVVGGTGWASAKSTDENGDAAHRKGDDVTKNMKRTKTGCTDSGINDHRHGLSMLRRYLGYTAPGAHHETVADPQFHGLNETGLAWPPGMQSPYLAMSPALQVVPGISIAADAATVEEGDPAVFTLTADPAPAAPLTVSVAVTQSGAFIDGAPPTMVTIATSGTGTLSVPTNDDDVKEADGSITATIVAGADYKTKSEEGTAMVEVTDDDVTFANTVKLEVDNGGAITEGGTALTITATLASANNSGAAYSIPIQVRPAGTTAQTTDYTVASSINIPNNAMSGTTSFSVSDDDHDEPDEKVIVQLGSVSSLPTGVGPGSPSSVVIVINDNDDTEVTFAGTTSAIAENGGANKFTVTLSRALESPESLPVTLNFSGTASVGTDYSVSCATATGVTCAGETTNTLTITFTGIASASDAATVTLTAIQDDSDEGTAESVTVSMGALTSSSGTDLDGGASGSGGPFTFSITDDDSAGLVVSPNSLTIPEGGSASYTVKLATMPSNDVTVFIAGHSGTDLTLNKSSLTFTTTSWPNAQTVTVMAGQDADTTNDSETLVHTASGGGYGSATANVSVTVNDDDAGTTTLPRSGIILNVSSISVSFRLQGSVYFGLNEAGFPSTSYRLIGRDDRSAITVTRLKPDTEYELHHVGVTHRFRTLPPGAYPFRNLAITFPNEGNSGGNRTARIEWDGLHLYPNSYVVSVCWGTGCQITGTGALSFPSDRNRVKSFRPCFSCYVRGSDSDEDSIARM